MYPLSRRSATTTHRPALLRTGYYEINCCLICLLHCALVSMTILSLSLPVHVKRMRTNSPCRFLQQRSDLMGHRNVLCHALSTNTRSVLHERDQSFHLLCSRHFYLCHEARSTGNMEGMTKKDDSEPSESSFHNTADQPRRMLSGGE